METDKAVNMAGTDSLDMLLIGRAGNGKSTTGNNILGEETFFPSADAQSKTKNAEFGICHFGKTNLKVVDCPGLGDTRLGIELDVKQLNDAIKKAFAKHPEGFHAIVYIAKFGNRFDKYDVQALETIKDLVGENFIKNHCILLMTGGDIFERDPIIKREKLSIEGWASRQDNEHFKHIFKECKERILLFDNRTENPKTIHAQKEKLVELIGKIEGGRKRYTIGDFENKDVKVKRKQLKQAVRGEQVLRDWVDKIGNLIFELRNAADDENGKKTILELNEEAAKSRDTVKKDLKENKKLELVLELFNLFLSALRAKSQQLQSDIENKGRKDEHDLKYKENKAKLQNKHKIDTEKKLEELEKKCLKLRIDNAYF